MPSLYSKRKLQGLCGYCGKRPLLEKIAACYECNAIRKTRSREYYTGKRLILNSKAREAYAEFPYRYWKKDQRRRFKVYGLTPENLIPLLELQEYSCAACWKPLAVGEYHIDHDHKTNISRGILHAKCNRALGQADDDPQILRSLATYLESSNNLLDYFDPVPNIPQNEG